MERLLTLKNLQKSQTCKCSVAMGTILKNLFDFRLLGQLNGKVCV